VDLLGPEAPRDAEAVHRGVPRAEDGHLLAHGDRRVLERELVPVHQVDAGQELVGAVDLARVLARDAEEHREARARADEDGVVAHLALELVDREGLADDLVRLELHAELLERLHLAVDRGPREAERRDAVFRTPPTTWSAS
jgi:hypothetical protein